MLIHDDTLRRDAMTSFGQFLKTGRVEYIGVLQTLIKSRLLVSQLKFIANRESKILQFMKTFGT